MIVGNAVDPLPQRHGDPQRSTELAWQVGRAFPGRVAFLAIERIDLGISPWPSVDLRASVADIQWQGPG